MWTLAAVGRTLGQTEFIARALASTIRTRGKGEWQMWVMGIQVVNSGPLRLGGVEGPVSSM